MCIMEKITIRDKAKTLRSQGFTYTEIQDFLKIKIPKSTLSYWCKKIELPNFYNKKIKKLNKINQIKARQIAVKVIKERRNEFLESLKKENSYLLDKVKNNDIKKIALAILYLGEGNKWKSHRGLMLGSSDPDIIYLYIKLLKSVYNISRSAMRAQILYRADQDINGLTIFWSKITGLPKESFYKCKPDSRTIGKPTKNKDYKGVCVVSCAGTKIQLELDIVARLICKGI